MLPSHADLVENILSVYDRADEQHRADGRRWYPSAQQIIERIAESTGTDAGTVAQVMSALSPRNPWLWNIADTYHYVVAHRDGLDMPSATTFTVNRRKAWRILTEGEKVVAPKVSAFVAAMTGDSDAVVVDTWAARVALNGRLARAGRGFASFKAGEYAVYVDAYRDAADRVGETPRELQAIVWLVAQTEGLASDRTGRHDLTFKAGTPEFIKTLLRSEEGLVTA